MTPREWAALAGLGAVALVLSYFSPEAALGLIGMTGVIAVMTHWQRIQGWTK